MRPDPGTASRGEAGADGVCSACGASLDGSALSEFARRLARFGLGATPEPLLNSPPGVAECQVAASRCAPGGPPASAGAGGRQRE